MRDETVHEWGTRRPFVPGAFRRRGTSRGQACCYYFVIMTIEYALTRTEVVRSFYRSLEASSQYLRTISIYALGTGLVAVIVSGGLSRPLGGSTAAKFLSGMLFYMLFLPIMLFLRAKTSTRSLTISPGGISTKIGPLDGEVPWKAVKVIEAGNSFVLIGRNNGNAFFIPDRAFHSAGDKAQFVSQAKEWTRIQS